MIAAHLRWSCCIYYAKQTQPLQLPVRCYWLLILYIHTLHTYIHTYVCMPIQSSLSLHFYLLYLHLKSIDGNDVKRNMLSMVDWWWHSRTCPVRQWLWKSRLSLADVQCDAPSLSHMHVTTFSTDQQLCQWSLVAHLSMKCCFKWLVSQTAVLYTSSCSNSQIRQCTGFRCYILSVHTNFSSELCRPDWTPSIIYKHSVTYVSIVSFPLLQFTSKQSE